MTPLRPYLWGGGATLVLFASVVVVLFLFAAGLADRDLPGSASTIAPQRPSSIQFPNGDHPGREPQASAAAKPIWPKANAVPKLAAPSAAAMALATANAPSMIARSRAVRFTSG